ncbi:B3 domain-containing protein REM16-like isoform X2 [Mercurialis annua]|uniref:B3 domain-containing protein REM16-like isoform X2 n=1 Tax=Mercurialis annua TaxID=3986 RepID=UPI00215E72B9|nr:B3 domain-containing protein REM16-like isoform X2 [Mercurialis annua]
MGEEEDSYRDTRSWEEEIYWTHFQCLHFSQFLHPGFHKRLAIPEQFTKNLRKKLPNIITLKGPSAKMWEVELTTDDDIVFFTHGWDAFVNDHSLRENDLLIFKYNGDSCFDVLMFDGHSMCEKAASYFVRRCENREQGSQIKRKIGEISMEATLPSPNTPVQAPTPDKSANNDIGTSPLRKPVMASPVTTKRAWSKVECVQNTHEEQSTSFEEVETKPDTEFVSPMVVHDVPFISSRRLISDEEKENVVKLALTALTSEGFMVIMKPTHVYRRFYMSIPSGWASKHLNSLEKQDVILRRKDNQWATKFYYQKSKNSGGLSGGWKNFAMANDLQEFDVCIFEPGGKTHDTVILDVNIFRVYQDDQ